MNTIEQLWQGYKAKVWRGPIPEIQERECRLAFMAGVASMLSRLTEIGELPEDVGVVELEKFHREMHDICTKVQNDFATRRQ